MPLDPIDPMFLLFARLDELTQEPWTAEKLLQIRALLKDFGLEMGNPEFTYAGTGRIHRGSLLWRQEKMDTYRRLLVCALEILGMDLDNGDGEESIVPVSRVEEFLSEKMQASKEKSEVDQAVVNLARIFHSIQNEGNVNGGQQERRQEEPQTGARPETVSGVSSAQDAREAQDRESGEEQRLQGGAGLRKGQGTHSVGDQPSESLAPGDGEEAQGGRILTALLVRPTPKGFDYIVQRGDTLEHIATAFGVPAEVISARNHLTSSSVPLWVGHHLAIPPLE